VPVGGSGVPVPVPVAQGLAFEPVHAVVQGDFPLFGVLVRSPRFRRQEDASGTYAPGEPHRLDQAFWSPIEDPQQLPKDRPCAGNRRRQGPSVPGIRMGYENGNER
jgi:hypothetical protein